jgi:hypothetical protein
VPVPSLPVKRLHWLQYLSQRVDVMKLARLWSAPQSLGVFFVSALGWFLVSTLLWMQVSNWTSYPVAGLTHFVLEQSASSWVRSVSVAPGHIEVETRITVTLPGAQAAQGRAELVAEANPARYAYGLPLLVALLLAARSRHLLKKLTLGYLLLLIPQTFSLSFELLRQIMTAGGRTGGLNISQWQMEGIAMGYQMGSLLLPTLAPVLLWLWLERAFFAAVVLDGLLRRARAAR